MSAILDIGSYETILRLQTKADEGDSEAAKEGWVAQGSAQGSAGAGAGGVGGGGGEGGEGSAAHAMRVGALAKKKDLRKSLLAAGGRRRSSSAPVASAPPAPPSTVDAAPVTSFLAPTPAREALISPLEHLQTLAEEVIHI